MAPNASIEEGARLLPISKANKGCVGLGEVSNAGENESTTTNGMTNFLQGRLGKAIAASVAVGVLFVGAKSMGRDPTLAVPKVVEEGLWEVPLSVEGAEVCKVTPSLAGYGCDYSQAKNLGFYPDAQSCANAAGADASCAGDEIMFSPSYPVWGCRCCKPRGTAQLAPNKNWNLYKYGGAVGPVTESKPRVGCDVFQAKNLGNHKSPESCAAAASGDAACTTNEFMFSKSYPSWGCRCCKPQPSGVAYSPNNNWSVYSYGEPAVSKACTSVPNNGCDHFQAKNLGNQKTAESCAAIAVNDPACTGNEIMFSTSYPSWGCRCCKPKPSGDNPYSPNQNWDVYKHIGNVAAFNSKPANGCDAFQAKNLGTSFKDALECADAALKDPACASNEIMWSGYSYAWGCRCCKPQPSGVSYSPNKNWNIYEYAPKVSMPMSCTTPPPPPTPAPPTPAPPTPAPPTPAPPTPAPPTPAPPTPAPPTPAPPTPAPPTPAPPTPAPPTDAPAPASYEGPGGPNDGNWRTDDVFGGKTRRCINFIENNPDKKCCTKGSYRGTGENPQTACEACPGYCQCADICLTC